MKAFESKPGNAQRALSSEVTYPALKASSHTLNILKKSGSLSSSKPAFDSWLIWSFGNMMVIYLTLTALWGYLLFGSGPHGFVVVWVLSWVLLVCSCFSWYRNRKLKEQAILKPAPLYSHAYQDRYKRLEAKVFKGFTLVWTLTLAVYAVSRLSH